MYKKVLRPILFLFDPEKVHIFVFRTIKILFKIKWIKRMVRKNFVLNHNLLEKKIFGLKFPNPVGLAAGFDKNAELIDEIDAFGFGFIEIGTVTPQPQQGNKKPRLFRLSKDKALVNRFGFNNEGAEKIVERIKKRNSSIIIGGNIGRNKTTTNEDSFKDYEKSFISLQPIVDYIVINVSSPNTPHLRELQNEKPLLNLLLKLQKINYNYRPKPILLKISPDLSYDRLSEIVQIVKKTKLDGIIATNTTVSREGLSTDANFLKKIGEGGISGEPLQKKSNEIISYLREALGNDFPIIGVGGINTVKDALDKIHAGASLLQIYTGFVYEGPSLIKKINQALIRNYQDDC